MEYPCWFVKGKISLFWSQVPRISRGMSAGIPVWSQVKPTLSDKQPFPAVTPKVHTTKYLNILFVYYCNPTLRSEITSLGRKHGKVSWNKRTLAKGNWNTFKCRPRFLSVWPFLRLNIWCYKLTKRGEPLSSNKQVSKLSNETGYTVRQPPKSTRPTKMASDEM